MKKLFLFFYTMSILNLFAQNNSLPDPFWEFNKSKHFRPKINKGDYYKLTGFDFGYLILEPMTQFVKKKEFEIEKGKSLSYGQKALYYWWYLDAQVTNGGFIQFYDNGYEPYLSTIIKSLEFIGDLKMVSLIQKADRIYQKNKKLIEAAEKDESLAEELDLKLMELDLLNDQYYKMNVATMAVIENYIRQHPNEICLDEDGKEIDPKFSGECKINYKSGKLFRNFIVKNGLLEGEFQEYFESGQLKEQIQYLQGKKTGEKIEYYNSGFKKNNTSIINNQLEILEYYENGNPKVLKHQIFGTSDRTGIYKEWFENGQLSKSYNYINKSIPSGVWLEFYNNGSMKKEVEFLQGQYLMKNFWNENGEQTLKDGNGSCITESSIFLDVVDRSEDNYKDYKRHGLQKTFKNGKLNYTSEYLEGKLNGESITYYKNGNPREVIVYSNDQVVSRKLYPISENPKGIVNFQYLMKDEWLKREELPIADSYPICLNDNEIKKIIRIPPKLFAIENQDKKASTCLWLDVNERGDVTKVKKLIFDFTTGIEFEEVASKMKFSPAKRNGKNVPSYIYIIADFILE